MTDSVATLIFTGTACVLITVSAIILAAIVIKHMWEGLMPYSLIVSILLGVMVILGQTGVFESHFVVDEPLASGLILLQLTLSVLYPASITQKVETY